MTAVDVMKSCLVVVGPTGASGVFVASSSVADGLVAYMVYMMD